ncbi:MULTISPECIES: hypothetical protein [unclassified Nocardioides]|uniref:hypothetical protein n=1 Tax=unclassified Nocardioides TaxID=2615069 RepID=UPI001055C3CE|nr:MULTISPECIES: hypothetical protein [unclassified Nocardioides]
MDRQVGSPAGDQVASTLLARVWRIADASYLEESTIDAIDAVVLPQIERLAGYCGGYLLADRDGGAILRISFWDSLVHLRAADVLATNAIAGMMVVTSGGTVSEDICEVVLSDPPPQLGRRIRSEEG